MSPDLHVPALYFKAEHAEPKNINLRKENNGPDEVESAVDISVAALVGASVLDQLEPGSFMYWDRTLWDEKEDVREIGLAGPIKFSRMAEGMFIKLTVPSAVKENQDEITIPNAKVGKFHVEPKPGKLLAITFQIQGRLANPDHDVPWLNHRFLAGSMHVELQGYAQKDLLERDDEVKLKGTGGANQTFPEAIDGTA